jgi:hypothetical protein
VTVDEAVSRSHHSHRINMYTAENIVYPRLELLLHELDDELEDTLRHG